MSLVSVSGIPLPRTEPAPVREIAENISPVVVNQPTSAKAQNADYQSFTPLRLPKANAVRSVNAQAAVSRPAVPATDSLSISPLASFLSGLGVDAGKSRISSTQSRLDFALDFSSKTDASLSANGFYAKNEKTLNVSLRYSFQQAVWENGEMKMKSMQATLDIKASNVEEISANKSTEKEDIFGFIRRIVDDVRAVAADEKKSLAGLVLDKDDLKDIAGIADGKMMKLLFSIVSSIMMMEQMKKFAAGKNQEQEGVIVAPERQKKDVVQAQASKSQSLEFSMSIQEVNVSAKAGNAENSSATTPAD